MEVRVLTTTLGTLRDDALVLLVGADEDVQRPVAAAGRAFAGAYGTIRERKVFTGKAGQTQVLTAPGGSRIATLVLAGRGVGDGLEGLRQAAANGLRAAREMGARSVSLLLPAGDGSARRADRVAEAVAEGALLGLYRFEVHRTEKAKTDVATLTLLAPRGERARAEAGARAGVVVGEAVLLARDLGNEPGNRCTPSFLAETARRIAAERGLEVRVFDAEEMSRLGMGALLGVARGSAEPPKLVVLTYEPRGVRGRADTVALVGKGLTFDSGGISIKPAAKMEDMKFDMSGGGAVIAAMEAIARLEVPVRVVGLVPATENMSGARAYKPGDVLKALNGVTIEVKNTDAEGRLILADALSYASTKLRPRPKAIVDIATLTGACVTALGDQYAGLMGNDERLAERVRRAGEDAGDPVWRLPIDKEGYRKQIESIYADVSNLGQPAGGGPITAAVFLERFVGGIPWAHLDVAGTAWTERSSGTFTKGATGFGVRLFCRLLRDWGRGKP